MYSNMQKGDGRNGSKGRKKKKKKTPTKPGTDIYLTFQWFKFMEKATTKTFSA